MSSSKSLFDNVIWALSNRKLGPFKMSLKKTRKLHKYTVLGLLVFIQISRVFASRSLFFFPFFCFSLIVLLSCFFASRLLSFFPSFCFSFVVLLSCFFASRLSFFFPSFASRSFPQSLFCGLLVVMHKKTGSVHWLMLPLPVGVMLSTKCCQC